MRAEATTSRRALLAAAVAALPTIATGCKGVQSLGTPPPPAPDILVLRDAISAEKLMVDRYTAAFGLLQGQLPSALDAAMRAVQAEHAAHLMQLKTRLVQPAGSAVTPSPSPTPAATAGLTGGVPGVVTALEQAEQAASDRLIGQLTAVPGSLAQLFASIAASEATHVPYLQAASPQAARRRR